MDYEEIVLKQKENNRIYNEFVIDLQAFVSLAPQVMNQASQETETYIKARDYLIKLCEQIGESSVEVKRVLFSNSKADKQ